MKSNPSVQHRHLAANQAATWLLSLQSEQLSTAQRSDFIDWLRQSPLHVSEFIRVCRLQRSLAGFKGWHAIAPAQDSALVSMIESITAGDVLAPAQPARHRLRAATALAASVLIAVTVAAWLLIGRLDQSVLRTQLGERREMALVDGSVVDLAPDSEVAVRYRPHERLITLNHGEALFHVAKNPNRPFIVEAAQTRVRAVGTVFNVERGDQGVSVTVVEGRVAVIEQSALTSRATTALTDEVSLGADEQVSISPAGHPGAVRRVQSSAEVGWASGQLIFDNATVAEIARRFNLYNRIQIQLLDPELANRRISGVFRASEPDSFVAFLQSAAGAHIFTRDDTRIELMSAPKGPDSGTR